MTYYVGSNPQDVLGGITKRYMYGLRRNEDGELYLVRVDQLQGGADNSIVVNDLGVAEENFPDFEEGIDFLEGIDANHNVVYDNLRYPQIKWDGRSLLYYIETDTGFLVQRVSEAYEYPEKLGTPGYGEAPDNEVIK